MSERPEESHNTDVEKALFGSDAGWTSQAAYKKINN
jgi:hypothetical protein